LPIPEARLISWRLMCRPWAMIGVIGPIAADRARYGISADITIAAAAG
jgi:hypothetical protein